MADARKLRISRRDVLRLVIAGGAAFVVGCEGGDDARIEATRAPAPTASDTEQAAAAIIRQVDHVLLRVDDAESTFRLFSETLQIPIAWPLFEYRGFHSGAVGFGSVNLEVLQPASADVPSFAQATGSYLIGIAFEPVTVAGAIAQLDARGILHSEPLDDGLNETIAWTSVDLEQTLESPIRLLVKYRFDQDARRAQLGSQLRERNGGPLGIRALSAIEVGVRDLAAAMARWQTLFDPTAPSGRGEWQPGNGPVVRVIEAPSDGIARVTVEVASLANAVDALRERRLLRDEGAGYAEITGLDGTVRLIQADA